MLLLNHKRDNFISKISYSMTKANQTFVSSILFFFNIIVYLKLIKYNVYCLKYASLSAIKSASS